MRKPPCQPCQPSLALCLLPRSCSAPSSRRARLSFTAVQALENPADRDQFQVMLPQLLRLIGKALMAGNTMAGQVRRDGVGRGRRGAGQVGKAAHRLVVVELAQRWTLIAWTSGGGAIWLWECWDCWLWRRSSAAWAAGGALPSKTLGRR
jgi:hypothetical protein